ncbi:hypothetical protein ABFS82_10G097400 [Erythranthe guttata]
MAKRVGLLSCWIEVAPAAVICPKKTSTSPSLETITEDEFEISGDQFFSSPATVKKSSSLVCK